jgi:hypothetical protein
MTSIVTHPTPSPFRFPPIELSVFGPITHTLFDSCQYKSFVSFRPPQLGPSFPAYLHTGGNHSRNALFARTKTIGCPRYDENPLNQRSRAWEGITRNAIIVYELRDKRADLADGEPSGVGGKGNLNAVFYMSLYMRRLRMQYAASMRILPLTHPWNGKRGAR